MLNFTCQNCWANLQVGDEWCGKVAQCCSCGALTDIPGPKRTSKLKILARLTAIPLALACLSKFIFGSAFFWGGIIAIVFAYGFLWAFSNLGALILWPRTYWMIRKGGGDPWFDTVDWPFNTDPPHVRFQELYRMKLRQEMEASNPPPVPPKPVKWPKI
jgi:hypothetical protein